MLVGLGVGLAVGNEVLPVVVVLTEVLLVEVEVATVAVVVVVTGARPSHLQRTGDTLHWSEEYYE